MNTKQLSSGVLKTIIHGGESPSNPVVQLLGLKKIGGPGQAGPNDRWRLLVSDGLYQYSSAMIATQLNDHVTNGLLETNTVMKMDKYVCNTVGQGDNMKKVLIILEYSMVIPGKETGKIGNPTNLPSGGPPPPQSAVSPQQPRQPLTTTQPPQRTVSSGGFYGAPKQGATDSYRGNQSSGYPGNQPSAYQPATPASSVIPIAGLNPYQSRWTIRARIETKGSVRNYSNARGDGRLFNVTFIDGSGEIRATGFNQEVDKFYDLLEPNRVYEVSGLQVKPANKQFNNLKNDYELTFNANSVVTVADDDKSIPALKLDFVKIAEIDKLAAQSNVDLLAVVKQVGELTSVVGRQSNKEVKKRDVQLVDDSSTSVQCTLWGLEAEQFEGSGNPVVAFKGVRVSDWNGKSLSLMGGGSMYVNPDVVEAHRLRGWWDTVGVGVTVWGNLSGGMGGGGAEGGTPWKPIAAIKEEKLGLDKADWLSVVGTVVYFRRENCLYQACPQDGCNKKLVDQQNGFYRCEKCNQEYNEFRYRLILGCNIADYSDNQWITCFQDSAETILGVPAAEVGRLREADPQGFENIFAKANFRTYQFKLKAVLENYNDEQRLKCVAMNVKPVDPVEYGRKLLGELKELLG